MVVSVFHWRKVPRLQVLANVKVFFFLPWDRTSVSVQWLPYGNIWREPRLWGAVHLSFSSHLFVLLNPVVKGSIARWLRTLIHEGGYTAHSARGAAASWKACRFWTSSKWQIGYLITLSRLSTTSQNQNRNLYFPCWYSNECIYYGHVLLYIVDLSETKFEMCWNELVKGVLDMIQ